MRMSYLGALAPGQERKEHSHFWQTISVTIARLDRLRKDPLFVVFFVWGFLFLLAAVIFAEV